MLKKTIAIFLSLIFLFPTTASASVSIDQTYITDLVGSLGGSDLAEANCEPGSVVVGMNGQDISYEPYSRGVEIICQPINSLQSLGSNETSKIRVVEIGGWEDFSTISCPAGQSGTGLNLYLYLYGSYIKNFSLNCASYPNQINTFETPYYGAYTTGTKDQVSCNTGFWMTGVKVRYGSGIDALAITCSTFKEVALSEYTISAQSSNNGTINPSGNSIVNSGASKTFTITPNAGFEIDVVTVDGISQGKISSYTFENVSANHEITATFKQASTPGLMMFVRSIPELDHFGSSGVVIDTNFLSTCWQGIVDQLNFDWGGSGPDGCPNDYYTDFTTGFIKAPKTGVVHFYNSADDGFRLELGESTVINNWVDQGPSSPNSSGSFSMIKDQIYPIRVWHHETGGGSTNRLYWNLDNNDWNTALLVPECVLGTTSTYLAGTTSCYSEIIVNQTANGSISPSNSTILNGTSKTFTITPNAGFEIDAVTVDGISQGKISSYTFNNVNQSHTITANFKSVITSPRQTTVGSCASSSSNATNKSQGKGSTQNANGICSTTGGPSKTK